MGACALLTAGAAGAQSSEPFGKAGEWQVAVERPNKLCKMFRYYGSSVDDHLEGVVVRYDAARDKAWLTWSTDGSTPFFKDGEIELHLNFVMGKSLDDSWGSRRFRHGRPDDTRFFVSAFDSAKDAQRLLRDLSDHDIIGIDLGPVMITALKLDAREATAMLRDCAGKLAAVSAAGN
jgi:hypothetical protein